MVLDADRAGATVGGEDGVNGCNDGRAGQRLFDVAQTDPQVGIRLGDRSPHAVVGGEQFEPLPLGATDGPVVDELLGSHEGAGQWCRERGQQVFAPLPRLRGQVQLHLGDQIRERCGVCGGHQTSVSVMVSPESMTRTAL